MAIPLLETKLSAPRVRSGLARPRLVELLRHGTESRLTLVSAPAGSGKTTLLADWAAGDPGPLGAVAWLSLDPGDDHFATFWTYVIAALQTVVPEAGASALRLLEEPQPSPPEAVLTTLINALRGAPGDIVLVIDDYHVVAAPDVRDGMVFFLDHLPGQVHVVISTRADPALPLARLRAGGELVEIRAVDLCFTPQEAGAYLNEVMGLTLTPGDVAMLEDRTEGWAAALQLAALSLQGREDATGFIAGFAGSDRYIVDYLVEEVLQRQPEQVRSFLLQTSILSHLTGPLCDAVTGQAGGRAMLEALDRGNLFLVPLDDQRRWYRYHHLFADVLQARLLDEQSDRVAELHRRACEWHERRGDRAEAVRHAFAGGDYERAAELVELALPALRQARQEATMRRWLDAIPENLYEVRPVLAIGYVGAHLASGDLDGVERRLRQAERWLGEAAQADDGLVVVDRQALHSLPGAVAVYRTALARGRGDVAGTIRHAREAFDVMGADDHLERGGAAGFLGLAYWSRGDLEDSHRWWSEAAASLGRAGHVSDVLGCSIALADIRIAQGRLHDAMRTYERGLDLASREDAPAARGVADMHVGISGVFREWNDLASATGHLLSAEGLGANGGLPQNPHRWRVAMALVRQAEGDLDGAVELLDEAEHVYVSDYFPDVRPIAALRARVWIAQGRLQHANAWARDNGLSTEDDLGYLREFEHVTLARLLLAEAERDRADPSVGDVLAFLGGLLDAARSGGRTGSVIEILVLHALAHHAGGDLAAALDSLDEAIVLSEPERHVRVFVDEGARIEPLLRLAAEERSRSGHARGLLSAIGKVTPAPVPGLVDPLTEREHEVLRLLATDLTGPDIAGVLFVSLNTVRTHTRSIYTKLGVNSRRTAVRRAVELRILPS